MLFIDCLFANFVISFFGWDRIGDLNISAPGYCLSFNLYNLNIW